MSKITFEYFHQSFLVFTTFLLLLSWRKRKRKQKEFFIFFRHFYPIKYIRIRMFHKNGETLKIVIFHSFSQCLLRTRNKKSQSERFVNHRMKDLAKTRHGLEFFSWDPKKKFFTHFFWKNFFGQNSFLVEKTLKRG